MPDYPGYFVRDDGSVRTPFGNITYGSRTTGNYRRINTPGFTPSYFRLHRKIAQVFVPNPRPDLFTVVDHINRDRADNRACNLRWLDQQLNTLNVKGDCVSFQKRNRTKQWRVQVKGMRTELFATREEAVEHSVHLKKLRFDRAYQEKLNAPPKTRSVGVQTEPVEFK